MSKVLKEFGSLRPSKGYPVSRTIPLVCVLKDFDDGVLASYSKNRGTRDGKKLVFNTGVKKQIREEGVDSIKIGSVSFGVCGDGLVIADGHSRIIAISDLIKTGELTLEEVSPLTVSVRLVDGKHDHLKEYKYANYSKAHSGKAKILNSDYMSSKILSSIQKDVGIDLGEGLWPSAWDIFNALNEARISVEDIDMRYVISRRTAGRKLYDILAVGDGKTIKINRKAKKAFRDALCMYKKMIDQSKKLLNKGDITAQAASILTTVGGFQYFMIDALTSKKVITSDTSKLTYLLKKIDSKYPLIKNLFGAHSNGKGIENTVRELNRELIKKSYSKTRAKQ